VHVLKIFPRIIMQYHHDCNDIFFIIFAVCIAVAMEVTTEHSIPLEILDDLGRYPVYSVYTVKKVMRS
jgi:hypothetical protein